MQSRNIALAVASSLVLMLAAQPAGANPDTPQASETAPEATDASEPSDEELLEAAGGDTAWDAAAPEPATEAESAAAEAAAAEAAAAADAAAASEPSAEAAPAEEAAPAAETSGN